MTRSNFILFGVSLMLAALCPLGCQTESPQAPGLAAAQTVSLPAASPIRYADVTERAGIRFTAINSRSKNKYLVETMGSGCGFIDFDNDGFQDILLLNGKPLNETAPPEAPTQKLYRNRGDGTFEDVTRPAGLAITMYAMGCAVGDFDNDGYEDIYISAVLGPGKLLRNNGQGRFIDVTGSAAVANPGMWGTSCAWVDVDNDRWLDLFVCN